MNWLLRYVLLLSVIGSPVGSIQANEHESSENSRATYVLATGVREGSYHQSGQKIASWLNQRLNQSRVVVVPSEGSVDNLNRLKEGSADIIIVQRDQLTDAYYAGTNPFSDIEILLPLFPEALQIFVAGESGVLSYDKFAEKIKSGSIGHITLPEASSTTYDTTRRVLNVQGLTMPHGFLQSNSQGTFIRQFLDGESPAIAFFSANPIEALTRLEGFDFGVISFSPKDLHNLDQHLRKLDPITLTNTKYESLPKGAKVHTVGTWAFLVARSGFVKKLHQSEDIPLASTIVERVIASKDDLILPTFTNNEVFHLANENGNIRLEGDTATIDRFFREIPLSEDLLRMFGRTSIGNWIFPGLALVLSLTLATLLWTRPLPFNRVWIRYSGIFWGLVAFTIMAWLAPEIVFWLEQRYCQQNAVASPILHFSDWERRTWLFLWSTTGYDRGVFPISPAARYTATSTAFLNYVIIGVSVIATFISNWRLKRRRLGMIQISWKDHIVICGWNNNAPQLLENLFHVGTHQIGKTPKIAVIYPEAGSLLKGHPQLTDKLDTGKQLLVVDGDAKYDESLLQANICHARTVILLADDKASDPDERTLLRALAISRHAQRQQNEGASGEIYIIAELDDPALRDSLKQNNVNEIVCTRELGNNVILQSCFYHGVNEIVGRLLRYNEDTNEFYAISLDDYPELQGRTYDELAPKLREVGILLLGIKAAFYEPDNIMGEQREIIDEERIEQVLKNRHRINQFLTTENRDLNLTRQVMINPRNDERKYRTDSDDQLFVLAFDRDALRELGTVHF